MARDFRLFLFDIVDAISKIEKYLTNHTKESFLADDIIQDAIVRRLQVIGEAVKNIPEPIKQEFPSIAWKNAAAMRDVVVHNYFGIDSSIAWDTVENDLPIFKEGLQTVLKKYPLDPHD